MQYFYDEVIANDQNDIEMLQEYQGEMMFEFIKQIQIQIEEICSDLQKEISKEKR
jgi:hypothetical protein